MNIEYTDIRRDAYCADARTYLKVSGKNFRLQDEENFVPKIFKSLKGLLKGVEEDLRKLSQTKNSDLRISIVAEITSRYEEELEEEE
jgi:hypothetical protein